MTLRIPSTVTATSGAIGRLGDGWAVSVAATKRMAPWLRLGERHEGHVIGLVGAGIVAFILSFAGLMLREIAEDSHVSHRRHVEQLTKVVVHQLGTTLFMIEQSMEEASSEIRVSNDPRRISERGVDTRVAMHLLDGFFFIDPTGQVTASASAETEAGNRIGLSDGEYFRIQLDNLSRQSRIGRPVVSRLTKVDVIPVSRPVHGRNGELMGVLVATIDVSALDRVWRDLGLRADDIMELIGDDATVWFQWPRRDVPVVAADGNGSGRDISASRRIAGWPMRVVVSVAQATVDRQTSPARQAIVASAAAGSLMVGLLSFLLVNRARQVARARDTAEAMVNRLNAAMDAVPVEFFEYGSDGRLVLANRAARQSQLWMGDPIGKTQRELFEEGSRFFRIKYPERDWNAWIDSRIAKVDRVGTHEFVRPDGNCGRFYVNETPDGGRIVVRVDITEEKRREDALASEMERLNSIFQSAGAGIVMLDRDARVLMVNQTALDVQGKAVADVIGRCYLDVVDSAFNSEVLERWQAATGTQSLRPMEYERVGSDVDGSQWILKVTANPIQDEQGRLRYIVLIGIDDTERRMTEIQLFDSARLANLGEMATGMAHEFNQPLAVIRMAAETLADELDTPAAASMTPELVEFVKGKIARISSNTDRASNLVNNLRAVARKPGNTLKSFDVVAAARVVDDLLHEQLKAARIDFKLDLPPMDIAVRGEAGRLQQVIINLVLNARDAILERVGQRTTGRLGQIVLCLVSTSDGMALLTVADDGPGIAPRALPRLFDPFFTTKPAGTGTGLGLSISYGIVKQMGGTIAGGNSPEGGALFKVTLPLAAAPRPPVSK